MLCGSSYTVFFISTALRELSSENCREYADSVKPAQRIRQILGNFREILAVVLFLMGLGQGAWNILSVSA